MDRLGNIIFLRHGQAKNNVEKILAGRTPGFPLTDEGIGQAEHAAELLGGMKISAVYSSPIQRASETAQIVGRANSIDVVIDERLTELDMGKFTGMGYNEVYENHGNVFLKFYNGDLEIAHNGVETFVQVKKRVQGMVSHVAEVHPDKNVVLVTHIDPIKAMLSSALTLSPVNLFEMIIANGSLNVFRESDGKFLVSGFNVVDPARFDQSW